MRYRLLTLLEPKPTSIVRFERKHPSLMRLLEPLAKALDHFVEHKLHHNLDRLETLVHPQEDHFALSTHFPIFAVADGVTLELSPDGTYPNPSPAGYAAELFCAAAIREAEARYEHFTEADLLEVFRAGNRAVGAYNKSQNRTRETSNWWDRDLFAATVAFAILKDNTLYFASLCDAYVAIHQADMTLAFRSPECWPNDRRCFPPDWESQQADQRTREIRRHYRNGVEEDGRLCGYGVATGEASAERYLNTGMQTVAPGDRVFLYSDGFEQYFELPAFSDLFARWPEDLKQELQRYTAAKSREDGAKFGHERTLIAINVS
jgi:hypothetical protein